MADSIVVVKKGTNKVVKYGNSEDIALFMIGRNARDYTILVEYGDMQCSGYHNMIGELKDLEIVMGTK